MNFTLLFLFGIFFLVSVSTAGLFPTTTTEFISEENYNCPEYENLAFILSDVSLARVNKTHQSVNGTMTTDLPFDNTLLFSIELKQFTKGQWQNKIKKVEKNQACMTANLLLGKPWLDLCGGAGVTPGKCPIPPSKYTVLNYQINFLASPVLKMLTGRFKIRLGMRQDNTMVFCTEHIFELKKV